MISPKTININAYRGTATTRISIFRGGPVRFAVTLDDSIDLTGCTSLRLDLRASVTDTASPLASQEITSLTVGDQYFEFDFSSGETNHNLTEAWLVLSAYYPEGGGSSDDNLDPLFISDVVIVEHNASLLAPAPPNTSVVLTQSQADLLYVSNNITSPKLLGRYSSGTGVVQTITLGANLNLTSGGILNASITGGGAGILGPASSVAGNILTFTDNSGASADDSGYSISQLLNRSNHTGLQNWSTISGTPTTLAGYGIADGLTTGVAAATYQPLDAELTALSNTISASNKLPYYNGVGSATTTDFTAAGRALLDDADTSAQRTTLGLVIGVNVLAPNGIGTSLTDLNAGNVNIGLLPTGVLPAFTGDVSSVTGSASLSLVNTAVTPGSYTNTNLTVDAKGRIIAASNGVAGSGGSGAASYIYENITQSGHGFSIGDALTYYGSSWKKAIASNAEKAEVLGLVQSATTHTFDVIYGGKINTLSGLTPNSGYFLSASVSGGITLTEPTGSYVSKPVLWAISPTEGIFLNHRGLQVDSSIQYQPLDLELTAIASLSSSANTFPYFTGTGAAALAAITQTGRSFLSLSTSALQRQALGLVIDTDVLSPTGIGGGLLNLNASNITSGTLATGRLPAFSGDASSIAGTSLLTLANTAVSPGSYINPNITIDSKGRITAASSGSGSPTTTRGDLIFRGASADERLPIGQMHKALTSDGVDPIWGYTSSWMMGIVHGLYYTTTSATPSSFNCSTAASAQGTTARTSVGAVPIGGTMTSVATSGSLAGVNSGGMLLTSKNYEAVVYGGINTLTNVRFYAGFLGNVNTMGANDTPSATNCVALRYSSVAGDTNWQMVTANGSTATVSNSSIPAATGVHKFTLRSSGSSSVKFWVDDQYAGEVTTTIPSASLALGLVGSTQDNVAIVTNFIQAYAVESLT